MSYDAPDADDFREAYPAFVAVEDEPIEAALAEASLMVDDSWLSQQDFTTGRLLYAAHVLTLGGLGTTSEAQFAGFSSLSIGSLSLTRAAYQGDVAPGSYESTSFGRRFLQILRQNKPPIMVVG